MQTYVYGTTYLLELFANQLGITADSRTCFLEGYRELLSIAFYLIIKDNNPLYRFEKWHLTYKHSYWEHITSPRSNENVLQVLRMFKYRSILSFRQGGVLNKNIGLTTVLLFQDIQNC